jgi:glycosyl transferase family 25
MEDKKIYVINLKRRPDRLQKFYDVVPFPQESINVVYGFDGKNYENESEEDKLMYNKLGHSLLPGEKGCFISHIRIFKDIIENNIPFGIVFEDDAILCEDFKSKFELLVNEMPTDTQMLYFSGRFTPEFKMEENTFTKVTENIVAHNKVEWGNRNQDNHDRCTHGYIISQSLARKFVGFFENNVDLGLPVDHWMVKMSMNNEISIYNSYPLLCHSAACSPESDIRGILH